MRSERLYLAAIEAVERFTRDIDEPGFLDSELLQSAVPQ